MNSSKFDIQYLLKYIPVLLYQGRYDYRDGPSTQYEWIHSIAPCLTETKQKDIYFNNGLFAKSSSCSSKKIKNIIHLIVHNAGHRVIYDQPEGAKLLIEDFISNILSKNKLASK